MIFANGRRGEQACERVVAQPFDGLAGSHTGQELEIVPGAWRSSHHACVRVEQQQAIWNITHDLRHFFGLHLGAFVQRDPLDSAGDNISNGHEQAQVMFRQRLPAADTQYAGNGSLGNQGYCSNRAHRPEQLRENEVGLILRVVGQVRGACGKDLGIDTRACADGSAAKWRPNAASMFDLEFAALLVHELDDCSVRGKQPLHLVEHDGKHLAARGGIAEG